MVSDSTGVPRAKLDNPNKPTGVFMLCGLSGLSASEWNSDEA